MIKLDEKKDFIFDRIFSTLQSSRYNESWEASLNLFCSPLPDQDKLTLVYLELEEFLILQPTLRRKKKNTHMSYFLHII